MAIYLKTDVFKGGITASGTAAPFYTDKMATSKGEKAGIYTGASGRATPMVGKRGGQIKKISPTTGKPIYFKKWNHGQGYQHHAVASTISNQAQQGYETYHHGAMIGRTASGRPIHAHSNRNNTKHFTYEDHRDAHHAHFALAQYLSALAQKKATEGKKSEGLRGLYKKHMEFARHHNEEALKDLLHGRHKGKGSQDLSKDEGPIQKRGR